MYNVYLLLLFFSFLSNKDNKGPNVLRETINRIDLNIPYTREKIEVLKKIGPYFPQEYIPAINKALIFTERFIKLYEAVEFIRSNESIYIKQSIPVNSNQERFNYIADTIKREFSQDKLSQRGIVVDTILTLDRFNRLFKILNSLLANPDILNNPTSMVDIMKPFMEGKGEKEKKQLEDMTKMLEIIKTLNPPKKDADKEHKS